MAASGVKEGLTAFVIGYTGEVGKELVKELAHCKSFSKVTLLGRRQLQYDDPEMQKLEQRIIDFENPQESADAFKADVGFCALGTTRKKSGADGFYKVDHDYVMNTAKLAKEGGCQHYSLCSSQGADKNSWFLYTKTKGEVEEELKELNFDRLDIFRPGALMCDREESRAGERCILAVLKPFSKAFPYTITTPTNTVAKGMINSAISQQRDNEHKWKLFTIKDIFDAAQSS